MSYLGFLWITKDLNTWPFLSFFFHFLTQNKIFKIAAYHKATIYHADLKGWKEDTVQWHPTNNLESITRHIYFVRFLGHT